MTRVTTTLSTKGQVILPKAVREHRNWKPGTRLVVVETAAGVLLSRAPLFETTETKAVFGVLKTDVASRSIEEMDAAVEAEATRRAGD